MTTALTADLGRFVAGLRYTDIPEKAVELIQSAFADCIGVMIAGAHEAAPQRLKSVLAPTGNDATLLFTNERASAPEAAWINGTAAHALDFDDVAERGGHISTVLVPAILAEAQVIGSSGADLVTAYAAGYETWSELARRELDSHHNKGWHPTGILGAIGAAAACASLRKLDAGQCATALALAASQSSGLVSNFGTMTKPFHAGRAAHSGLISARLAQAGFTAATDALEHSPGYLMAVSEHGRIDLDTKVSAGTEWTIVNGNRLSIKKYPMCFCTHRAIDGMLDLAIKTKIDPVLVKQVVVSISRRNETILRNHAPQTGLEGKFSMEFAMASALIARRVGLPELTDPFVCRADVQAMLKRVTITPDDSDDPMRPGYAIHDRVKVETRDGQALESGPITKVRGDADLPLSKEDLWAKFEGCVQAGRSTLSASDLFGSLMKLNHLEHVRNIPGLSAT